MSPQQSADMDVGFARHFVLNFLERTRFADRFPPRTAPPAVEAKAREIMRSWKLDISDTTFEQYLVIGLELGYAAYQHTPHAVQVAVTLFTACAAMFDDVVATDIQAMREFIPRICTGQPQRDPTGMLTRFIESAGEVRKYLPDYTANMVHTCMMGFANEELCGLKDANQLTLKPDAGTYIEYSRYKNGIAEPYAACIWPSIMYPNVAEYIQAFPDTVMFTNYINDLLSSYKEALEDDDGSYLGRYARMEGKTLEQSVDDLTEKVISLTERIRRILGEGQAREAWEDFASGYVHFNLFCPRYRWKEVVPEYF